MWITVDHFVGVGRDVRAGVALRERAGRDRPRDDGRGWLCDSRAVPIIERELELQR